MARASRPRAPEDALGELIEAGGAGLRVTTLEPGGAPAPDPLDDPAGPGVVRLGVCRSAALPTGGLDGFDILLTDAADAPAPWVSAPGRALDEAVELARQAVARQPIAAGVAAQVLRMSPRLSFADALAAESLAYSMLLASGGFRAWRAATPARRRPDDGAERVALARTAEGLSVRLTRPAARNAVDARMRDALAEALDFALLDPDRAPVILSGEGPSFSAGGDLDEFGQADDPGRAHAIRVLRSAAGRAHLLGARLTARLHGACIGAGIEIPAAAGRVTARRGAYFRLPEVAMGLIPGAGGTASIPRRIGRQRACWMAISGADIDVATALDWGLIDAREADA
jgi:enoyl-CoA hydratase/carnithine racemase